VFFATVFFATVFFASVLFLNTYNSWLQSLMQIFCNYTLVQFPFFFSCSHRNKPADFAMGHFSFLQSLTTQACNHIPNNQVALQANRQSQVSIFATHITTGCNHVCRIVAITHWLSFFFLFFPKHT
jgi:hypothetical protein